ALDQMADEEDPWGIGGHYKNGGILVFADYITDGSSPAAAGTDDDAFKIGGSFQVNDMFAVYAQYEDGALLTATQNEDANQWMLAGSATMGGTTLYLGFGQAEDQGAVGANWEQDSITLAVNHKLSKRTDIYGGWAQTDIDGLGEEDLISVGMRHKF
ncbi:MAG TPA: porin, partial [Marinobacter sp.]